jgi:hypothetical protein
MALDRRWIGVAVCSLALSGCVSSGALLAPNGDSLATELADETPSPRLARSQRPDSSGVSLRRPVTLPAAEPTGPVEGATQQTNLVTRPGGARVNVLAWVNGRPIFEEEVAYALGGDIRQVQNLPEPTRTERLHALLSDRLDKLIDAEVLYQDGVSKLEKVNPRALDKLKEFVGQEFDKQMAQMQHAGVPEDAIRDIEPIARRATQRSLIAMEYLNSRIKPMIDGAVDLETIKQYYEGHKSEFQNVDKVTWQDIFIAAGPGTRHASVAEARRFAEQLLASCRSPDDFKQLLRFDDGDSKLRGGEGAGQRRGEIQPSVLEPLLFTLREGEIGPFFEMPNGIHLVRVSKREYAGQVPLNEATQKTIRNKLMGQLREREARHFIRELRNRAVIRKENQDP